MRASGNFSNAVERLKRLFNANDCLGVGKSHIMYAEYLGLHCYIKRNEKKTPDIFWGKKVASSKKIEGILNFFNIDL